MSRPGRTAARPARPPATRPGTVERPLPERSRTRALPNRRSTVHSQRPDGRLDVDGPDEAKDIGRAADCGDDGALGVNSRTTDACRDAERRLERSARSRPPTTTHVGTVRSRSCDDRGKPVAARASAPRTRIRRSGRAGRSRSRSRWRSRRMRMASRPTRPARWSPELPASARRRRADPREAQRRPKQRPQRQASRRTRRPRTGVLPTTAVLVGLRGPQNLQPVRPGESLRRAAPAQPPR